MEEGIDLETIPVPVPAGLLDDSSQDTVDAFAGRGGQPIAGDAIGASWQLDEQLRGGFQTPHHFVETHTGASRQLRRVQRLMVVVDEAGVECHSAMSFSSAGFSMPT